MSRLMGPSDRKTSLAPNHPFDAVVAAFGKDRRVVRATGKGFGSGSLKVDGRIFAMISSRGQFVVKLPRDRVAELVDRGIGEHFDAGRGRAMKEWLALDHQPEHWLELAREARLFVGG